MAVPVAVAREKILQLIAARTDQGVSESLLLINNKYVGHRFRFGSLTVDWLLNKSEALLRRDGQILERLDLSSASESRAA